jgi:soluble lytic murein transglycosylase-like protein
MNNEYDDIIRSSADLHKVPFTWLKAIIGTESSFDPWAMRAEPRINDASRGLGQLLMRTARALGYQGDEEGLFDLATNIDLAARLVAELVNRCGMDFRRVYSAYNSGGCETYLTSPQVQQHVHNAVAWLNQVEAEEGEKKTVF